MKLSEQTSIYVAEYMKTALKHSKKFYSESKNKSESDSDSSHDKNFKDDEQSRADENLDIKVADTVQNGTLKHPARDTNGYESMKNTCSRRKIQTIDNIETSSSVKHKTHKRVHDSSYVSILENYERWIDMNYSEEYLVFS